MGIRRLIESKKNSVNQKMLHYYLNNCSDVVFSTGVDFVINYCNDTFCALTGFERSELIGSKLTSILDGQNGEKLLFLKNANGSETFRIEITIGSKTGSIKKIECKTSFFQNKLFIFIGRDITAQEGIIKEKDDKIKTGEEEKARSQEILNSIGDGVISLNDKGEVIYVNKQAIDILGFHSEELIGKLLWKKIIMTDDKGQEVQIENRPIRMALFTRKRIYESSYYYKSKDGRFIPVSITATPLVMHDMVVGGVDVFRDITKEREVDRMKTEFISLASHQLRTPLSATKWFAELILDDSKNLNIEQLGLIKNIYTSNQRMIDLVNALLNISRIESGRIIIDPKPTDLRKLVEEVVLELTPKIKSKKHNVILSIHGDLPLINIDPRLIRNAYMNLLTNSIKYTKEGGEISIIISKRENELVSQVSDNGLGIPDNQRQRIFEKFFRSSNVIKVETDGTGLGLYLAKAIIESSGGKIWFDSVEYKGTTFWFTLPLSGSVAKEGEVTIDS